MSNYENNLQSTDMLLESVLVNFLIHYVSKTSCFVNLAHSPEQRLQGNATWNVYPHENNYSADKAVDGNINQTYLPTCAIAAYANNYKSVWWKVWLSKKYNMAYLEIYFRLDTKSRATGFSIYVYENTSFVPPFGNTGRLVFHHDHHSGCPNSLQNITVNKLAQGVAFYNERPIGFTSSCSGADVGKTSIEICELRVMGCDQNRYHFGCSGACNAKCKDRNCDVFNGSCIYGCSNPNAVSLDCIVCDDGAYAFNGNCIQCGYCVNDTLCDKETGRCFSGCKENWRGDLCKTCKNGYYGTNCTNTCGKCKQGTFCHHVTGKCEDNCQGNWLQPYCTECKDGFYGENCSLICGNCASTTVCDKDNGTCPMGCQRYWTGHRCDSCEKEYFGMNCTDACGKCKQGTFCSKETGVCPEGCENYWFPPYCNECEDGFHGKNCSVACGKCVNASFCNKEDGTCPQGCKSQWTGPLCDECVNGFYGRNCSLKCGNCANQAVCNKRKEICSQGCMKNWLEPLCEKCKPYKYGHNCVFDCGHCKEGKPCYTENGTCPDGCESGWEGIFCRKDKELSKISLVIISVISTLLTVLLLSSLIIIIYIRRTKCLQQNGTANSKNDQISSKDTEQKYDKLAGRKEEHQNTPIDSTEKESAYQEIHIYRNTEFNGGT